MDKTDGYKQSQTILEDTQRDRKVNNRRQICKQSDDWHIDYQDMINKSIKLTSHISNFGVVSSKLRMVLPPSLTSLESCPQLWPETVSWVILNFTKWMANLTTTCKIASPQNLLSSKE